LDIEESSASSVLSNWLLVAMVTTISIVIMQIR
jgi:hypothetical protein